MLIDNRKGCGDMIDWQNTLQNMADLLLGREPDKYYDLNRYYILREVLKKPENDPKVVSLRKNLIREILNNQSENGSWNNKVYNYEEGTTHQVMKLIDLGLNVEDEHILKAVNYILSFQAKSGAFVQHRPSCGVEANLICTTACVLALARTGHADDPRILKAYQWLCGWQQEDGSWLSPDAKRRREKGGYPYCYCGLHATCNVLLGLSASERMRASEAAIRGINYLLGLYGLKHKIDVRNPVTPPLYRYMTEHAPVPFEGAWHDPRVVPPDVGSILPQDMNRKIEVFTTQHVLGTLCVIGYGFENEKVKKGLERLLELMKREDISFDTIMVIKRLYEPSTVFHFRGH
jgi:hypothetical protein